MLTGNTKIWIDTQKFNQSYDYWCQSSQTTFEVLNSLKPVRTLITLNIEKDTDAFSDILMWLDLFKPHLVVKFH